MNTFLDSGPCGSNGPPRQQKTMHISSVSGGVFPIPNMYTCKQIIIDYEYPWFLKYSKPPNIICLGLKPYKVSLYALTFLGQNLTNNSFVFVFKDRMGKQLKHAQGVLPTETFLFLQSQFSTWLQLAEMKARSNTC